MSKLVRSIIVVAALAAGSSAAFAGDTGSSCDQNNSSNPFASFDGGK